MFLALLLGGGSWEPPPRAVEKLLDVVPGPVLNVHGYVAGVLATRDGRRPALGFFV